MDLEEESTSVVKSLNFLKENGMPPQFRKNGGNVITVDYLGSTYFVGLEQFKFRKAKTSVWTEKLYKVMKPYDTFIGLDRFVPRDYRNKPIIESIKEYPKYFEQFMHNSPLLFSKEVFKLVRPDIDVDYELALNFVMPWGKYQNIKLEEILRINGQYLEWLYNKLEDNPNIKEKLKLILNK